MKKVIGFLRIIRPINCVMMGFAVIVGAIISTKGRIPGGGIVNLMLGFITAFTLTGASMAINDYYDREIDAINEPSRPIPSGLISPMESIAIFTALTIIGLLSAMLINNLCLLLALASIIVSTLYSTSGKRTGLPGNIMVSACVSMPFIYGGTCVRGLVEPGTLIFAAMAFLINTGREIIKGIADIEGDKVGGIKTLAISYGPKRAAEAALALIITAVAISPLPVTLNLTNMWFIPLLLIANTGFIISAISVAKNTTRENSKKAKKAILACMLISLIAFLVGTIK
ncbi:MAG: geranylgeranylglycerol-phosphate geranylgeranyltransferase [Candidatus Bathyarchaeia archaeon]|nr:geranylgeranylglycerol-phosphate geranylgeranyltransferase [Candidatus Bathyarchaeota archaeon]